MKKATIIVTMMAILFSVGCSSKNNEAPALAAPAAEKVAVTAEPPKETETPKAAETPKAEEKPAEKEIELIISAAASLKDVTAELQTMYKEVQPNVKLTFAYGASGALQTQIEEGAPTDIFISAAQKQMIALEEKGLIAEETKKDLLENSVVLIVPKDSKLDIKGFEDCGTDKVKTIALGEAKAVPVGQYSEEIFDYLKILDAVKKKANYGSDVRQVLTWVEMGEVDCGVVYATDAAISDKINVVSKAPENSHKPVIYPIGIIKESSNQEAAQQFVEYLFSDKAKPVFEKYGFLMVK